MNRVYRVVFNRTLRLMQAVAETGKTRNGSGKTAVAAAGASLGILSGSDGHYSRPHPSGLRVKPLVSAMLVAAAGFGHGYAQAAGSSTTLTSDSTTAQTLSSGDTITVDSGVTLDVDDGSNTIAVKGSGTIYNYGTVEETGSGSDAGRVIRDKSDTGLTLTVYNYGAMYAQDDDVIQIQYSDNNVALYNYGKLISNNESEGGAQAVDFSAITTGSNYLYNAAGALIEAYEADAVRPGVDGVIDNYGTIYSYNASATPDDGSDGIDAQTNSGVTITNGSTGVIEGARHGITGGNSDTSTDGSYTMSVTNAAGGVIEGDDGSGINIDGFNANEVITVNNQGTLTGDGVTADGDGVDVDGLVDLTNSGTIQSLHAYDDTSEGVTVGGGTIVNTGTIAGYNSATNADGTTNTGTGRGITLAGLDKDPTTGDAIATEGIYADTTVDNSGLIYGQSDSAIAVTGAANDYSVSITNEAGGVLEGGGSAAVVSTGGNDATVINYGTIQADGTGDAIDLGSGDSSVEILGGSASVIGNMDGGTGTSTLTITPGTGYSFSYGGVISDFSSVDIGAGMVTLSGSNTYTGATTIDSGGTLALSGTGGIADSSSVTDNGTLDISDTTAGASITSLSGSGTVALGSENLSLTDASGAFGGTIGGSGDVTVGGGTETLTGNNTYTGTTTIDSGATLALANSGSIAASSGVVDDGTFDISDTTSGTSVTSLSGSGTVDLGSNTLTLTDASGTFSGTITGSGGLTLENGTETLTGVSDYTGATTIDAGATLVLSAAGDIILANVVDYGKLEVEGTVTNLSGDGNVTLGSNGLTLGGGTFDGTISGSGALTLSGDETLTGTSTYTGATTIDSGATLALTGTGSIADSSSLADDGTFDVSGTTDGASITSLSGDGAVTLGSKDLTLSDASGSFSGVISGSGGLTVGGGSETLSGANTYTGTTTVDSGATLALMGSGSIAASSSLVDNGTFDISGTASGATVQNLSGAGTVALGSQTLTLADASGTFSGAFTGSGTLLKEGSGMLTLNGNSASFTGTTEIAGGTLEVGDANTSSAVLGGDVTVDADGTLRGHGTIDGDVDNDGTVEPGGSVGTLTVEGNYAQSGSATFTVEITPTSASELVVGGTATLNGTMSIIYDPGTYTARTYTLISAAKGVSGTFSTVTSSGTSNLGSLTASVSYSADAVELDLASASGSGTTVVAPTDTSIYTAAGTAAILAAQAQSATVLSHLGNASKATEATPATWFSASGVQTKVGGSGGEPGFQTHRYGFLAGLEQKFGEYTAGVSAGYDHTDLSESSTGDSGMTDTLRAALYGARALGPVNLGATLGVGLDFLSQKRPFGSVGTAEGDHLGEEFNLGGQASLPMTFGSVTVTPRVGLRYAYFHSDGFDESGASGQNLSVGTDNVRSLQPYVGVTFDRAFGDAVRPIKAELRIGYAYELLDANRAISVASQDGTLFTAAGTTLPRGYLTAGAGVTLHPRKNLAVSLDYDGMLNTAHASSEQGSIRVSYKF